MKKRRLERPQSHAEKPYVKQKNLIETKQTKNIQFCDYFTLNSTAYNCTYTSVKINYNCSLKWIGMRCAVRSVYEIGSFVSFNTSNAYLEC